MMLAGCASVPPAVYFAFFVTALSVGFSSMPDFEQCDAMRVGQAPFVVEIVDPLALSFIADPPETPAPAGLWCDRDRM